MLDDGDDYTDELNDNDEQPKQNNTVSSAMKRKVDLHHSWKKKAYKDMPKGSKEQQAASKFVSNHTHYSTTDPDAGISVKPGKPRQLNYHAQVAVDTAHHARKVQADVKAMQADLQNAFLALLCSITSYRAYYNSRV